MRSLSDVAMRTGDTVFQRHGEVGSSRAVKMFSCLETYFQPGLAKDGCPVRSGSRRIRQRRVMCGAALCFRSDGLSRAQRAVAIGALGWRLRVEPCRICHSENVIVSGTPKSFGDSRRYRLGVVSLAAARQLPDPAASGAGGRR